MSILTSILFAFAGLVPSGDAWLEPLQPRDSVLVADQFEYGFRLDGVEPGTTVMLQDFSQFSGDTLVLVRDWKLDTLRASKGTMDISGSVVVAPFEEGRYTLPGIAVRRVLPDGQTDTLLFNPAELDVKTMPVDTATFVINDIKGQMRYPLTFKEILPWVGGALLLAALVALAVWLIRRRRSAVLAARPDEPPYVVALRSLDRFKDEKYWAGAEGLRWHQARCLRRDPQPLRTRGLRQVRQAYGLARRECQGPFHGRRLRDINLSDRAGGGAEGRCSLSIPDCSGCLSCRCCS